ncbi:MAG: hypothetical protein ACT4OX_05240 [Actinomycetota bacterium]
METQRIAIRQLPVELFVRSRMHSEALMREFAFIAEGNTDPDTVPVRLLQLVERLRSRYGGLNTASQDEVEAAITRGDEYIDVEIHVPVETLRGIPTLAALLEEVDEFCANGDLLTLRTPEDVRLLRVWYLDQIRDQLSGSAATPWPAWRGEHAPTTQS